MDYIIREDSSGTRHFKGIIPESVNHIQVLHRSEIPYLIGYLPSIVLSKIRTGDRFYSLGMTYVVCNVTKSVCVEWID